MPASAPSRFGSRSVNGRESPSGFSGYSASPSSRSGFGMTSPTPRNVSLSRSTGPGGSRSGAAPVDDIEQARAIARTHYFELLEYLTENGQAPQSRSNAREKLTRLTRQQFQELSTDVYDELCRRKNASSPDNPPHLLSQDAFHPKRNQARQKLATLPMGRFRDLGSDVFFELERRYPEFKEDAAPQQPPQRQETPPPTMQTASAAPEVLVPNKSTLVEEEVGMPPPKEPFSPERGDDSLRYDRDYSDKRSMGRGSETSSVGGKLIGGYGHTNRSSYDHEEQNKMRSDYEYKIATMQQRITALETDLQDARTDASARSRDVARLRGVEDEVRSHQQRYDEQTSTVRGLQRDLAELQAAQARNRGDPEEGARLRRDLDDAVHVAREHEEVIGELRKEVKGLLDELRSLNGRHEELLAEHERAVEGSQQLEGQVATFKQRYETAKTELRNMKATSQLFVQPPEQTDFMPATEDGAIADVHVTAFQSSVDSVLVAGRSSKPSSVLSLMKAVVVSITRLDSDITDYERRRPNELPDADRERLQQLKAKCNATLSNLVTAAKNHAAGMGMSPVSLLDAAASHLSVTVVDMVKLVRVRKARADELDHAPSPVQSTAPLPRANGDGRAAPTPAASSAPPQRIDALRTNGPTSSSRNSPVSPVASNGFSGSSVVAPPIRGRDDTNDSYTSEPPQRYGSTRQPAPAPVITASPPPSAGPSGGYGRAPEEMRGRAGNYSPEFERNGQASPLSEGPASEYDQGPGEAEDFDELRAYLEQQTEAIVHSIQALLAAIRGGAQGEELNDNLTNIITIVSSIVAISKENLPAHAKREGDIILADLADNCDKLSEMQSASHSTFSKQTKQSLASASFGVAKALKALNSFLAREADDLT